MHCYDFNLFKEQLHIKYKPPKITFYSNGTKIGNGLLTFHFQFLDPLSSFSVGYKSESNNANDSKKEDLSQLFDI